MASHEYVRRATRFGLVALAMVVFLGCEQTIPSGTPASEDSTTSAPTVSADPQARPDADVLAVAALGIDVVEASGRSVADVALPEIPMLLQVEQLTGLGAAARAGIGLTGADLDALLGHVEGMPDASSLLRDYVRTATDPGAVYARSLVRNLDAADPAEVVYPTLARIAIEADQLRALGATPPPSAAGHAKLVSARLAAASRCEAALQQQPRIDAVTERMIETYATLAGDMQVDRQIGLIWSDSTKTGFFFREIQQRLVTLTIVDWLAAAIPGWTPVLSADPSETRKGVAPEDGLAGTVRLHVDAIEPTPQQAALLACGKAHGVNVDLGVDLLKPTGNRVSWSIEENPPGLAVADSYLAFDRGLLPREGESPSPEFLQASADTTLDSNGDVTFRFHTTVEADGDGPERIGSFVVRPTIQRLEWQGLLEDLYGGLLAEESSFLSAILEDQLRWSDWQSTIERAAPLIAEREAGTPVAIAIPVTYHESDQLAAPDPCSLITQAEAAAASGFAVKPGERRAETFAGGFAGQVCAFLASETPSDAVAGVSFVRVSAVDIGRDAASLFSTFKAQANPTGSIGGLGDDDFYLRAPEGSTVLAVRRSNIVVWVTVITPDGLAQATAIARRALTRF